MEEVDFSPYIGGASKGTCGLPVAGGEGNAGVEYPRNPCKALALTSKVEALL
jgi:hypothetical protein